MNQIALIPQTQIYSVIPESNPLHELARKHPLNMCWLTSLFYVLQYLGFENNNKLHRKLSFLLSSSLGSLFISKEDGAMYFPKKYELSDADVKNSLNEVFDKSSLQIRALRVLSDIKFEEIALIEKYLSENRKLIAIVKNSQLGDQTETIIGTVVNHTVVLKEVLNLNNGRIQITYLDPADGKFHFIEIGVNIFMQWVQYIWILDRKVSILQKIFSRAMK